MGAKACGSNPAKCCTSDGYYKNHDVDITAIHHSRRSNFKSQHMFICQTPRNQNQRSANNQYISNNKRNTYQFCVPSDDHTDTDNHDREHIPTLHDTQSQYQSKSRHTVNNAPLKLNPIQSEPFGISTQSMHLVLGMKGVDKLSGGASPTPDWSPRHKNKNRNIPIVVPQHYNNHDRVHSNSNSPHSGNCSPYSPYSPRHQLVHHHLRISPIDEQAIMDDIELSDTADIDASIDTMDKQEMKLQLDEMDPFEDYNPFDVVVPDIVARQGMDKSELISPKQDHVIQPPGVIVNRRSSKTPETEIISNIISPLSVNGPNSVSPHSMATMARNYGKDRSGRGQRQASMDTINSDQISIAYDEPDQEDPNVSNFFPDVNNITPRDTDYKMDVEPIKVTSTRMSNNRINTNITPRARANTTGGFTPKSIKMSRSTPIKHRVTQTMIFNEFDLDEEESNTPTSPFYDNDMDQDQMEYKINILSPLKRSPKKSPALQRSHSQHIRSKAHNDIYDGSIPMFDPSGKGIDLPPISLTRAQSDQRSNLMRKQSLTTWKEHEISELENEMKRQLQLLKRKSTSQSPRNIARVNHNLITTTLPQSNINNHTIYVPSSKVVQHGHTHQPQHSHIMNNVMAQLSQGGSEGKIVYGSEYQRFTSGIAPIQLSGSVNSYGPPQPYDTVMDGVDIHRQGTTPIDDDAEFEMELADLDTDTDTDEGEDEDTQESELSEIEGSFNCGSARGVSPNLNAHDYSHDAPPSNLLRAKSANKWDTNDINQQEMDMMEQMAKLSSAHLFESH